ncbi:uncharacterized protein B0T15DRAFT_538168 [Chaetomium strumarium]|uniref:Uncharacterized protein n=1 Tax=Chaetomium strumarium TaxID=1170767 RepID=A0AAJ0GSA6_9PEZI|nr:hypothetical protein B0T15DRAFT_538168 [Chaetomium strumarium]
MWTTGSSAPTPYTSPSGSSRQGTPCLDPDGCLDSLPYLLHLRPRSLPRFPAFPFFPNPQDLLAHRYRIRGIFSFCHNCSPPLARPRQTVLVLNQTGRLRPCVQTSDPTTMATSARQSRPSSLMARDALQRLAVRRHYQEYRRHCHQDRGPLPLRPHITRNCWICVVQRQICSFFRRTTRLPRHSLQDSADRAARQRRQQEPLTPVSEENEFPPIPKCKLGICDTGYDSLGGPLLCECDGASEEAAAAVASHVLDLFLNIRGEEISEAKMNGWKEG